jgi:hypothetical protein
MKRTILSFSIAILALTFVASKSKTGHSPEKQINSSTLNQSTKDMNSYVSIFEIPATDISRAINFIRQFWMLQSRK